MHKRFNQCFSKHPNSYDEWVKRGFKETSDEMVDIFYQVMNDRNYN